VSVTVITLDGNPVNLVALPAYPGLAAVEFTGFDGIGLVRKPFTGGGVQAQQWHGGDMWSGKATLPMMTQSPNADNWLAFLEELRGMSNAFQLGDPLQPNARGSGAGRPRVDNNAAGGNAPGSQALTTRGWTANAVGVLLAGDYIQLGYRLYRCLDDITADADGNAVVPIWPCLREQPFDDGTAGGWVNASGQVGYSISRSLGNNIAALLWSNFFYTSAPLPGDAMIQGIYPVIVISGTYDVAFQYVAYGYNLLYANIGTGVPFPNPSSMPWQPGQANASFASTIAWGPSLGTDLNTVLPNFNIEIQLNTSTDDPFPPDTTPLTDNMAATQVGLAIYYTSATPATDIQMTPPFAVPAGQGVSFALPLNVEKQGAFGNGGQGFFDLSTGYSIGTGAVDNGLLTLNNTKGIWRLASNKRDWKSDFDRLTAPQFPFQEYR
jgi:hypothetical protein